MRCLLLALLVPALGWAQELAFETIASGLTNPTDIQAPHDGSNRLFVLEQAGTIRIIRDGQLLAAPFLDLRGRIASGGERGLLGLAFSPSFAESGRFYVNYTNTQGDTEIAMYRVSANPDVADPASRVLLLSIDQPFANHNGGGLVFGPDGFLYIGMGDGGSAGDPQNNAQNLGTLLGKMLRVDVESEPGQIRIPPGNPFVNQGGARPEIWAYGLRNPWRYAFDRANGDLWIADVGQREWEEIDFQPASNAGGENYGWNTMEGNHCYNASSCNQQGLTVPVAEYDHSLGCSVTGGYVYRGSRSAGLRGTYLYADYCSGRIWGVTSGGNFQDRLLADTDFAISTFGQDEAGEIYIAGGDTIYRIFGIEQPRLAADSVVNPASFRPGLTPGSLATAFASGIRYEYGISQAESLPLPTQLDGVSVLVDGRPAPIHVVANVNGQEQVNFQVPYETPVGDVTVVVRRRELSSEPVTVAVRAVHPAIFTGNGIAIVVHAAGGLVTAENPLREGEVAYFYAVGLGSVTNQPATGAASPDAPLAEANGVRMSVGGAQAAVDFAGLAPGLAGVYQVNFRVPQNIDSGLQNIVVASGGESSPAVQVPVE